jgi:hypothetical protein
MFKYAIIHPNKRADLTIKNSQNLTPLNLAAKLGRENLFSEMLELKNVVLFSLLICFYSIKSPLYF